uniref:Uncharacterized protein n=1 Tax=Leptobrachium leishanense TaxID=445787 RepID=A0A8C5N4B1_9ANUR
MGNEVHKIYSAISEPLMPHIMRADMKCDTISAAAMEETQIYNQRLHGITEKRRILTQVETIQRELEQQRLKLMQLKRKSLRDRWLMEGLSPAPEAENDNPLAQTEGKIRQLEVELEGLQSRLIRLENPVANDIKAESTKISAVLETHLVNGEQVQDSETPNSVEGHSAKNTHELPHGVDQNTSGHPVPAPRAKKAETQESKQNQDEQHERNENAEHSDQNHGELDEHWKSNNGNLGQMDKNRGNLDQNSQNHDITHSSQNRENQIQNEERINLGLNVAMSGGDTEAKSSSEETNEVHHQTSKLVAQNQSEETTEDPMKKQNSTDMCKEATVIIEDQNDQSTVKDHDGESSTFPDTSQQNQAGLSVVLDQNQEHISIPEDENHVLKKNNEDQNQELSSATQAHYQDKVSEGQDQNREPTLIPEDKEQNPESVTQDQDLIAKTLDQSKDPIGPTHIQESTEDGQRKEHMPFVQVENQSTGLLFQDQPQVHDTTLPHQDQSQKLCLASTDQIQDFATISEAQKPSSVMQPKKQVEATQVHISHVKVIAHDQHSPSSQQFSSAASRPIEEVEPLLHKTKAENTNAPHGTNTAESRNEKPRSKEKTCQCCVVM